MYLGRHLGRLKDIIYFTHSYHSRFLQIADIVIYMANRFENNKNQLTKWHDIEVQKLWNELKGGTDFHIQRWPLTNPK
ncbi:MAG TPA: DUF3800 domain-containing protein [Gammaproteobacteria bacterium]|jgi:hypothetical protein|nr:DUF3800 domain-containing protein [Gammaproteobacteria bacterium]